MTLNSNFFGYHDITQDLLDRLHLFSQYAAVAGCDQNNNSTGSPLSCEYECSLVRGTNTTTLIEFQNESIVDTTGYIALDHTRALIILAFRGNVTKPNWKADFNFTLAAAPELCKDCWVHQGFWGAWEQISPILIPVLSDAVSKNHVYSTVFVGHSLGGAIVTIVATLLRKPGNLPIDLYAFGATQIGDYPAAEAVTRLGHNRTYRVTHTDDAVPRLPGPLGQFAALFLNITPEQGNFTQLSPEYWITADTGQPVTLADIQYVEGIGSEDGNAGTDGSSPGVHNWHIGNMSACITLADSGKEKCSSAWCSD
ncbi:hypothetical protein BDV12DRAFT_191089 [Aspergillus spectabilis]